MSFTPDNSFELSNEKNSHVLKNVPTFGSFIVVVNSEDSNAPTATFAVSKNSHNCSIIPISNCKNSDELSLQISWVYEFPIIFCKYKCIVEHDYPIIWCRYNCHIHKSFNYNFTHNIIGLQQKVSDCKNNFT